MTKKQKTMLLFGAAFVLTIISLLLIKNLISKPAVKTEVPPPSETRLLVVASSPIPAGSLINRDDVKEVKWPAEYYPAGHVFDKKSPLIGRVARRDILPEEPIYAEKLAAEKTLGGLTVMIPPGMRAITVRVSDVIGVAGFLKPGDRVDVLTHVGVRVHEEEVQVSKTLAQNVLVLASDQTMVDDRLTQADLDKPLPNTASTENRTHKNKKSDSEKDNKKNKEKDKKAEKPKPAKVITMALWPTEVEAILLAEETGSLRLTLRPEDDHAVLPFGRGVTDTELFRKPVVQALGPWIAAQKEKDLPPPASADEKEAKAAYTVELITGVSKEAVGFDSAY